MMIPALVSVTMWFDKRRPLAVGIAICGAGGGMFLYSSIVRFLLDRYDLRGCFLVLGAIILNGCVYGLLLRAPPSPPHPQHSKGGGVYDNNEPPPKKSSFDMAVFRNWKYDIFLLACFLFCLGFFPVFMFVTSRAVNELGWTHAEAAFLLTVISIANVCGRVLCAVSLGRSCVNNLALLAFVMLTGGVTVSLSLVCNDHVTMLVFCSFYGWTGGEF